MNHLKGIANHKKSQFRQTARAEVRDLIRRDRRATKLALKAGHEPARVSAIRSY